jgi:peptidyl-prolyl cis-trans isomerase A (cyclophilin A)
VFLGKLFTVSPESLQLRPQRREGGSMEMKIAWLLGTGFLVVWAGMIPTSAMAQKKPGLYATLQTNQGTIVCELFEKEAPETVKNFIGLADGTKEWKDPKSGAMKKSRYYDGLTFHRVIPDFMIQGGDPTGTGTGGPGYRFKDEFNPSVKFDKAGRLAMANSGPNTNGSQFFITEVPTPHLNNAHTIFGQVIEGMAVVKKIARVRAGQNSKPVQPVVIEKVVIERVEGGA